MSITKSKLKIRYFRTTPQQADGAFARKLLGQSTDYHEFFKNKEVIPISIKNVAKKKIEIINYSLSNINYFAGISLIDERTCKVIENGKLIIDNTSILF